MVSSHLFSYHSDPDLELVSTNGWESKKKVMTQGHGTLWRLSKSSKELIFLPYFIYPTHSLPNHSLIFRYLDCARLCYHFTLGHDAHLGSLPASSRSRILGQWAWPILGSSYILLLHPTSNFVNHYLDQILNVTVFLFVSFIFFS